MHEYHCSKICKYTQFGPKFICKTLNSLNYKMFLLTVLLQPTKQLKNLNGCSLLKTNRKRAGFMIYVYEEAEYLLNFDPMMSFCAYQLIACTQHIPLVQYIERQQKTYLQLLGIKDSYHLSLMSNFMHYAAEKCEVTGITDKKCFTNWLCKCQFDWMPEECWLGSYTLIKRKHMLIKLF
ncbi:unnamed protein product [Didymodactylos carnosus]|uniref:Uncharacterized protein n=1 Tax=Didymodactylos carnosus TaxID=1234261 RepID=A0A815PU22_9BILA|nr:unnamed protein product [Didymodactylos carnosus]CAF4325972.1 unnamed protein product [Didymodactylos carnosus]